MTIDFSSNNITKGSLVLNNSTNFGNFTTGQGIGATSYTASNLLNTLTQ